MTFPEGRYGRRRQARRAPRWVPAAAIVVVVLASLLLAGRLYRQYGDPYQPSVPSLEQVADSSVTVSFTVSMGPAVCRIKAKDGSGTEVGYAEVKTATAGPVRATVSTTWRAERVEVLGCRPA